MAYQRISDGSVKNPIKADSLDGFVSNLAQLYKNQLAIRNANDELNFNEQVLGGNLSLTDQLQYRKDQLKRVTDAGDPDEKRRIRGEIANLKDRIEQQAFTDAYTAKLTDFQSGAASIDNVISFLNAQKAATTDQNILNTINSKLAEAQQQKFSLTQSLVKNNSEYATTSKSVSVIDTQIAKVQGYRASALLTGNDQLVSVYDLQIQSLNSAKAEATVTNNILSLGAISATGAFSAIAMLDALNNNIAGAASDGPVTVSGTQYASAKDFWTFKRDSYLSDSSANGFFPSLNSEVKDDINTANSKNTLTTSALSSLTSVFNTLSSRPELANYQKQIDIYKQDTLQTGANAIAQTIVNDFTKTLDVSAASAQLNNLKGLGVNVDNAYTQILTSNASTKNSQVQGILSAAQTAMQNDPSLTPAAAIAAAVAAGAGTVVSPAQAATKTETQIATDAATTSAAGAGTNDARTTVAAPTEPANTPNASGSISSATLLSLPNLAPGMNSPDVKTLQNYLIQQGYQIPSGATGLYGPETTAAVKALQEKLGIDNSTGVGYFGPRTKSGLSTTQPATTTTPAPAPTPTVQQATPQPTAAATPAPAPAVTPAPATNTSYSSNADYLKVKSGAVGQAGDFGRTPNGIVQLSTGKLLT